MVTVTATRRLLLKSHITNAYSRRVRNTLESSYPFRLWDYSKRWQTSYPSHEVVGMPSLSPTMEAGSIASWAVEEGQSFDAGDVLCEIETDKATVSFEAQDEGAVAKILTKAGPDEIKCGEPILITVEDEGDVDAFKDYALVSGAALADAIANSAAPPETTRPHPEVNLDKATTVTTSSETVADLSVSSDGRTVASPLAWTVAKDKGLDLSSIAIVGTGPEGRIIADDVREFIPSDAIATQSSTTPITSPRSSPVEYDDYIDYPLSQACIESANLLVHSKQTVPHYYLTVDVTLDNLISLRSKLNAHLGGDAERDQVITLNDLILKATACAMKSCPDANASWLGNTIRRYHSVDVNFVMGNGETMYAPLISSVDKRGIKSISSEIYDCLDKVKEGCVVDEQFTSAGTVSVMNLGMYGIKSCAPIIRSPQAVALALGAAENRVVPGEYGNDADRQTYDVKVMLTATLSCDHRVVDGAIGAQWLSAFKTAVENPEVLLL